MSRITFDLEKPIIVDGLEVVEIAMGIDHACGFFYCCSDKEGEVVTERDQFGFGLAGPEFNVPLTKDEWMAVMNLIPNTPFNEVRKQQLWD